MTPCHSDNLSYCKKVYEVIIMFMNNIKLVFLEKIKVLRASDVVIRAII